MNLFRTKLITIVISFGFIISALIGFGLHNIVPDFDWNWFIGMTVFFLVLEPLIIYYVEGVSRKKNKKGLLNAYMLTKVVKIVLGLLFAMGYTLSVKENTKSFILVFVLFYLLYLTLEAFLFIKIEKHIKNISNNE